MALVADSSGIIALLNRGDDAHAAAVAAAEGFRDIIIPVLTLVEIDYWCRKRGAAGAFRSFVDDIDAGAYRVQGLDHAMLLRAQALEARYEDLDLGIVDASVIALCEQLDEDAVLTLDRRDFRAVRPQHCAALRLLPD